MVRLIETYGGKPLHAPAMREVPLSLNPDVLKFADALFAGHIDVVIFLTGVGARALVNLLETGHSVELLYEALRKVSVVARGPKPLAVLREWKVPVTLTAPEPNTWRELLQAIDGQHFDLGGKVVAVQEYGASNPKLLEGLRSRGARVMPVPVYQWDLPEDQRPLHTAIDEIIAGRVDVALFTTSVQVVHLFRVAEDLGKKDALRLALARLAKASIGPTTSEALASFRLSTDIAASRPKMGFLVKEAAEQAQKFAQRDRPGL